MTNRTFFGEDPAAFRTWLAPFFPEARVYRSSGGQTVVIFKPFPQGSVLLPNRKYLGDYVFVSDDGMTLRQTHQTGSTQTGLTNKWNCELPDGKRFFVLESEGVVTLLDRPTETDRVGQRQQFRLVTNANEAPVESWTFVPLPTIRVPEYLFVLPDDRVFYIDAPKYGHDYDRFRCFVWARGALVEIGITGVHRLQDGGTTLVYTREGTLFSPAHHRENAKPYWLPPEAKVVGMPINLIELGGIPGSIEIREIPCRGDDAANARTWYAPR